LGYTELFEVKINRIAMDAHTERKGYGKGKNKILQSNVEKIG
jgi:hypothetical protein